MVWISGTNEKNHPGNYSIKGVPNEYIFPSGRVAAMSWIDSSNNLYLFGGISALGYLNDLWKFDGKSWTWISGTNEADQPGEYGRIGVPDPSNTPGARESAASWIDSSNNLYLFGGQGIITGDTIDLLNDLWKFDGKNWTWISGSNEYNQPGVYGDIGIADLNNVPGGRYLAVSWIDSSDNLFLFGGDGYASTGTGGHLNDLWKFDGKNWTWISGSDEIDQPAVFGTKRVPDSSNVPGGRYCAVSWIDSSDNLYLFGGYGYAESENGWLNDLWKFDGANWTWVSGSNKLGQRGKYGTQGIPDENSAPGARYGAVSWIDSANNLYLFGGTGHAESGEMGRLNDLWKFDGANWTWLYGSKEINQPGEYSTKGTPNPSNVPGGRYGAVSWIDSSDNLYLFGGSSVSGYYNDLWVYTSVCFGLLAIDPQVCSGRGKCVEDDICECTGAIGDECEVPTCFGIPANDTNVCSSYGQCVSPDQCSCEENRFGAQCEIPKCFGFLANDSKVCSGHGNYGWDQSIDCSVPLCFGKSATNSSVCSGRGTCISKDFCKCEENWFGKECEIPQCFGILANESKVCNGNGNCRIPNVCTCETGWTGNDCSTPLFQCFGKNSTDRNVCSGRGNCTGENQCKCNPKYTGKECTKDRLIIVYAAAGAYSWNWLYLMMLILLFISFVN